MEMYDVTVIWSDNKVGRTEEVTLEQALGLSRFIWLLKPVSVTIELVKEA